MSFSSFLDIIINSFNQLLKLLSTFFNSIIENPFVKLIIFIIIIYFIIYLLNKIIELIINIFTRKQEASKNKVKSTTEIE